MEDQLNTKDVKKDYETFNFWHLYKHDPKFNRSLEFDQKGIFSVTVNQEELYLGTSLEDAVWAYNWMKLKKD